MLNDAIVSASIVVVVLVEVAEVAIVVACLMVREKSVQKASGFELRDAKFACSVYLVS